MALDFESLLQNPLFQTGLATLGGAGNPGLLNAYNALQAQKKMRLEEQQRRMQEEQHRAELEQSKMRMEIDRERLRQYARQNDLVEESRKEGKGIYEMIINSLGGQDGVMGSQAQTTPSAPTQPGSALPPEPVGKYGTPIAHLDNLMRVESSGNPLALGPLLPGGQRAKGAYQFLDSTRAMLEKQGYPKFDPFNPQESRDAADFYIQSLVKKHGGDYSKAYAEYGGFKTQDPTSYIGKITGSPEKQAQQSNSLAAQSELYKRNQKLVAALAARQGDITGATKALVEASKPDYESERIRLQQEANQRAEEASRRAEEANQRAAEKHKLESEAAAREKADPKLTEAEAKATTYMRQMQDANAVLSKLSKEGWDPEDLRSQTYTSIAGGPLNIFAPVQAQQAKQAQEQWAEAYLRFKTGAATNADEISRNIKTFFPQIGDKPANIAQKQRAREDAEKAMSIAAGKGAQKLEKLGPPGGGTEPTSERKEVKRWRGAKSGRTVIQYSDGSTEYGN